MTSSLSFFAVSINSVTSIGREKLRVAFIIFSDIILINAHWPRFKSYALPYSTKTISIQLIYLKTKVRNYHLGEFRPPTLKTGLRLA